LTQAPLQSVYPVGHDSPTHRPSRQRSLAAQAWLQAPQWALLVLRFTHSAPHWVNPVPQVGVVVWHTPPRQVWFRRQALPQAPQWLLLELTSTHSVPHRVCPGGHAGVPSPSSEHAGAAARRAAVIPKVFIHERTDRFIVVSSEGADGPLLSAG
jgi:hypothetical protein